MSDKESDGPQKSHVTPRQIQNLPEPEFDEGDKVQIAKGPNGRPIKLTVLESRLRDGEFQYKLKDKDGNIYSDKQGKEDGSWFLEGDLEHAQ